MNFTENRFAEKRGFRLARGGLAAAPGYRPASCCLSMYFVGATLGRPEINRGQMPNFTAHFITSGLIGLGAGIWISQLGFPPEMAALACGAALTGGLAPDLDSSQSRPLKIAASLAGLAAALITLKWLVAPEGWLWASRWKVAGAFLAALAGYFLVKASARALLCRLTRHRGLFHSLAVPFLIGGIWALALAGRGRGGSLAVGLAAAAGVFSHLLLDALASRSLSPLKLYTNDKLKSALLWLITSGLALIWLNQAQNGPGFFLKF